MSADFRSDNVSGVAPEIMAALVAANQGTVASYGADPVTARLEAALRALFECDLAVLPVATGTAANALALASCVPPWGAVYCHALAHIACDECGAPEFFTGGAKLVTLDGADAKLAPDRLAAALEGAGAGVVHHVQPAAVSVSQATEAGTVYRPEELAALADVAHRHGCKLHVDGARFANALATLGCSPAEASWRAGVDLLSFGATKNGALAAEAVILFDPAGAESLGFRRKRAAHLFSKMRFLSAQLEAYLADDLWLRHARHANAMAARLAAGLAPLARYGLALAHPVEANEVFVQLPEPVIGGLAADGFGFHRWGGPDSTTLRLVTAWNSDPADIDRLVARTTHHAARGA